MAAIADASDGVAPALDEATAIQHFGCAASSLPTTPRRTVAVRAGGRGGKTSRLIAPKALHAAWTTPLPTLRPREIASALLVAPDVKLARQALTFVAGYVEESPILKAALVGEPTKDGLTLRRKDGKVVRIEVLAATRGGRATRGRTLVFAGLDEACFFYDETSGVVNDADIYRAVSQRVVPGGQVWIVSTPWLAKTGLLETTIDRDWGKHEHALCAIAPTRALNPTWDPTGEIEADLRSRDPDAARREIDGQPLAGTAVSFFEPAAIDAAVDELLLIPRPAQPGEEVTAGGDFGFRSDSSALVVVHRDHKHYRIADLLELRPSSGSPLRPSEVVSSFAERLQRHAGLQYLVADSHYRESVTEHLARFELAFKAAPTGAQGVAETFIKARALFREGRVKLPNHPRLLAQLRAVEWRPNPGGTISIVLPRERMGGHCDLVSAMVLALWEACGLPVPAPTPKAGTAEYYAHQEAELVRQWEQSMEDSIAERKRDEEWSRRDEAALFGEEYRPIIRGF